MRLRLGQLAPFADSLELDVERTPVCRACLSFVSMSLGDGDAREAKVWARRMTPDIWAEGLAEPALAAVRAACEAGLLHAEECLADLEERGGRSVVARAIVLRLAADLCELTWTKLALVTAAQERLALAPPEWN
jgi:hypothetical protein